MKKIPQKYLVLFLILSLIFNVYFLKKLYIAHNYEKYTTGNQIVMFFNTLESLTLNIEQVLTDRNDRESYTRLVAKNEVMKSVMVVSDKSYPKLASAIIDLGDQVYQTVVKYFYNKPLDFSGDELTALQSFNDDLKVIVNEFNTVLKTIRSSNKTLSNYEPYLTQIISEKISKKP